jgi:hypothetical protein
MACVMDTGSVTGPRKGTSGIELLLVWARPGGACSSEILITNRQTQRPKTLRPAESCALGVIHTDIAFYLATCRFIHTYLLIKCTLLTSGGR